jgi:hypothetical protein
MNERLDAVKLSPHQQDSGKTRTRDKTRTRLFSGPFFAEYASVFFSFIPIILRRKNASSSLIVLDCGVWPSFERDDCLQAAW